MASPAYNDGSVPYGSVELQIPKTTGDTFVADDFELTLPTKIIERTNEWDEPEAQVAVPGFIGGSATLQIAAAATTLPALGDLFTFLTVDYFVSEIGTPLAKGDYKKVRIAFRKKLNA